MYIKVTSFFSLKFFKMSTDSKGKQLNLNIYIITFIPSCWRSLNTRFIVFDMQLTKIVFRICLKFALKLHFFLNEENFVLQHTIVILYSTTWLFVFIFRGMRHMSQYTYTKAVGDNFRRWLYCILEYMLV